MTTLLGCDIICKLSRVRQFTDNKLELPERDNLTTMYCFYINTAGIKILTVVNIAYAFFIPFEGVGENDRTLTTAYTIRYYYTSKVDIRVICVIYNTIYAELKNELFYVL